LLRGCGVGVRYTIMANLGWHYLTADDKSSILRGVRDRAVYGGPYHAEIHPADRCNIDCFFCSTAAIRGTDELHLNRLISLFAELKAAGTRSIRFAGGGEPLFHRKFKDVLRAVIAEGLPVENVTTNAVLLSDEVGDLLINCCDEITVSLNTADSESYSRMMRTSARNFDRVLSNVDGLLRKRNAVRSRRPHVSLQFLVWRENYRSIPQMYDLGRRLGVDSIFFNGLSFLRDEQLMNDAETSEMLRLYEEIARRDEFRRVTNIASFERDIAGDINSMIKRLSAERESKGLLSKAFRFLWRDDFSLAEKIRHHRKFRRGVIGSETTELLDELCVIGWYSMVIRSDGTVAPCCILQHKNLGNVGHSSVAEIWNSPDYDKFRVELSNIIASPNRWLPSQDDRTVEAGCGLRGTNLCPMKTFYFRADAAFVRSLSDVVRARSAAASDAASPDYSRVTR
jgi:MoaA/NifB/PqqE/SkfB family radical SAM enzyme